MEGRAPPWVQGPLIGRDGEAARLEELLERTARRGAAVQIIGEAGVGKSRLARAACEGGLARGRLVVEGRAEPGAGAVAHGLLRDALRDARRRPGLRTPRDALAAELPDRLLPELGGDGLEGWDQGALQEAALRWASELARPAGLVLLFEDLHWADASSLALVRHLARTGRDEPILLVLTYRPEETPLEGALAGLRADLARERSASEILLRPLAPPDASELLRRVAPPRVLGDEDLARRILSLAEGNPFALEELARSAAEGLDAGGSEIPDSLAAALVARARRLSPGGLELLRWAAAIGQRMDVGFLAAVAGLDEEVLGERLDELERASFLVSDAADPLGRHYVFRHALTRAALRQQRPSAEARARHARILQMAERSAALAPEELAAQALAAGNRESALRYSHQAAARAREVGADTEARRHLERALGLWTVEDGLELRADLMRTLGEVIAFDVRGDEAIRLLREARETFLSLGRRREAALTLADLGYARSHMDRVAGNELYERALTELGADGDPDERLRITAALAINLSVMQQFERGGDIARAALAAEPPSDSRAGLLSRSRLLIAVGSAAFVREDAEEGERAFVEAAEIAERLGSALGAALAYCNLAALGEVVLPLARVVEYADRSVAHSRRTGLAAYVGWCLALRAWYGIAAGELALAAGLLDEAEPYIRQLRDDPQTTLAHRHWRADLLLARGAAEEARDMAMAQLAEADAYGHEQAVHGRALLARASLALGEDRAAARWSAEAFEVSRLAEASLPDVVVILAMAEAAALRGDAAAAARVRDRYSLPGGRQAYLEALAILGAGRSPPEGLVEGAASALDADGRLWEAGWMRAMGAELLAARPDARDQARELARRGVETFRAMGSDAWCRRLEGLLRRLGERTRTRGADRGAAGLTAREHEVLALVAEGLTNRQIAGRLVISEGTAIRHVANVFGKLGVHSRAEAARIAAERGLTGYIGGGSRNT
jgi:DNA-binding CsgD family transcriptional regulator